MDTKTRMQLRLIDLLVLSATRNQRPRMGHGAVTERIAYFFHSQGNLNDASQWLYELHHYNFGVT